MSGVTLAILPAHETMTGEAVGEDADALAYDPESEALIGGCQVIDAACQTIGLAPEAITARCQTIEAEGETMTGGVKASDAVCISADADVKTTPFLYETSNGEIVSYLSVLKTMKGEFKSEGFIFIAIPSVSIAVKGVCTSPYPEFKTSFTAYSENLPVTKRINLPLNHPYHSGKNKTLNISLSVPPPMKLMRNRIQNVRSYKNKTGQCKYSGESGKHHSF